MHLNVRLFWYKDRADQEKERVTRVSTIFVFEPRKIIILENSTMTNHRPILLFYYFVHVKEKKKPYSLVHKYDILHERGKAIDNEKKHTNSKIQKNTQTA